MAELPDIPEDVAGLLSAVFDGEATVIEQRRLAERIQHDPQTCKLYVQLVRLEVLLRRTHQAEALLSADLVRLSGQPASQPPTALGDSLSEAMILPAIRSPEPQNIDDRLDAHSALPGRKKTSLIEDLLSLTAARSDVQRASRSHRVAAERRRFPWRIAAAILLPLLLAVAAWSLLHSSAASATFAVSSEAKWEPSMAQWNVGQRLPDRAITLESGLAKIDFDSSASAIIEGPATFRARSNNSIDLNAGRLTAIVPAAAHGFTVRTPSATVVDLGTEFGVAVADDQSTHLEVFRGTVQATPLRSADSTAAAQVIVADQAVDIRADTTTLASAQFNPSQFVQKEEFDARLGARAGSSYQRWLAYSYALRRDPDLVAYYLFDNANQAPDRLLNQSSFGSALDGALGGNDPAARPIWTTGRWPQKGALEFGGDGNSRVVVPSGLGDPLDFSRGQQLASALTIAAWVQPEARESESIAAKGFSYSEQFALETARGWIRQTAGNRGVGDFKPWNAAQALVGWSQLVLTFDPIARDTRLYRNGVLNADTKDSPSRLLQIDAPMTIGCRPDQPPDKPGGRIGYVAAFHGRIDELLIMRRAMSADEVRDMYLTEKPN